MFRMSMIGAALAVLLMPTIAAANECRITYGWCEVLGPPMYYLECHYEIETIYSTTATDCLASASEIACAYDLDLSVQYGDIDTGYYGCEPLMME